MGEFVIYQTNKTAAVLPETSLLFKINLAVTIPLPPIPVQQSIKLDLNSVLVQQILISALYHPAI